MTESAETRSRQFFQVAQARIEDAWRQNEGAIQDAAKETAARLSRGGRLFTFGCGHSGLVAQDVYYRAGGLMDLRCLFAPEVALDREPPEESSRAERNLEWVARRLPDGGFLPEDVLVVISTSGVNAAPVEMARRAAETGALLIALTSREASDELAPRHPSGHRLHELAAIVLDNRCPPGDALIEVEPENRMASAGTALGALLLQALILEIWDAARKNGLNLPIYVSGNRPGGMEENRRRKGRREA